MTSMTASIKASLALHGRAAELGSDSYGYDGRPLRLNLAKPKISKKLTRNASKARKMAAKAIRNTQVPA
jgi:hypothetical protein